MVGWEGWGEGMVAEGLGSHRGWWDSRFFFPLCEVVAVAWAWRRGVRGCGRRDVFMGVFRGCEVRGSDVGRVRGDHFFSVRGGSWWGWGCERVWALVETFVGGSGLG